MSRYFSEDNKSYNQFKYDIDKAKSDIELLEEKHGNIVKNLDKISIFKLYMSLKEASGITPNIKVSHQNIFHTKCDCHNDNGMSVTIYDKMGYASCYGCGEKFTAIDLISQYIHYDISESTKVVFNSIEGLAIEVADAFINGVKYSYDEEGKINGYDIPHNYRFVNDADLVLYYVNIINKHYDSAVFQRYLDMSASMTEKQDERMSNYINVHGVEITDKFANKLCLDKKYIKYRLYNHSLDDKLTMDRIIEFAKTYGHDHALPFASDKGKEVFITFYENNDDVLNGNIQFLTDAFNRLKEFNGLRNLFSFPNDVIRNIKIDSNENKFRFSIYSNYYDTMTTYEINIVKAKNVKDIVFSSIYNAAYEPDATVLSIIGGDYDLRNFPSENEDALIEILESNGVEVLFANNKYTCNEWNSAYMLNYRPISKSDEINWSRKLSASRYRYYSSYDRYTDGSLEKALNLLFTELEPVYSMLGEIIVKTSLPEVWKEREDEYSAFTSVAMQPVKLIHISDQSLASRCIKTIEPLMKENRKDFQRSIEGSNEHRMGN